MDEENPRSLVGRLLSAGAQAPQRLIEAAVRSQARRAQKEVRKLLAGAATPADVEDLVQRVIRANAALASTEGAAAGITMTVSEVTSVVGTAGTLTVPAAAANLAGDLAALGWIQVRMVMTIAGLYGHDLDDHDARARELFTLMGVYGPGSAATASTTAGRGAERMLKRLLMRHLAGEPLRALTALFRVVGIRFSRAALIRALPLANIPINAVVNATATRALGRKAQAYYSELPAAAA